MGRPIAILFIVHFCFCFCGKSRHSSTAKSYIQMCSVSDLEPRQLLERLSTVETEHPMRQEMYLILRNHFNVPMTQAKLLIGFRSSSFKKLCRLVGVQAWPFRHIRYLRKEILKIISKPRISLRRPIENKLLKDFLQDLHSVYNAENYGKYIYCVCLFYFV